MFLLIVVVARFALLTILLICSEHDTFADRMTPKCFADSILLVGSGEVIIMNSTLIGTRGKNTKKCLAAWKSVFTV